MGMSLRLVEESRCKSVDTALVTSRPTAAEYEWELEGGGSIAVPSQCRLLRALPRVNVYQDLKASQKLAIR